MIKKEKPPTKQINLSNLDKRILRVGIKAKNQVRSRKVKKQRELYFK